jgi:hypothetical protein
MNGDIENCSSCSELLAIHEVLKALSIYDGEPPLLTLSMLISEVKMWRAKDDYERKLKLAIGNAIINKTEKNDKQQMAGPIFGLN